MTLRSGEEPQDRSEPPQSPKAGAPAPLPNSPPCCRARRGTHGPCQQRQSAGEPRPYQGSGQGDTGPFLACREGREGERQGERAERSLRALVPAGEGGLSPVRRAEGCARRHAVPLRVPPPRCRRGFMCSLYRTCWFSLTLGSGSERLPLVGSAERHLLIGGVARPRPGHAQQAALRAVPGRSRRWRRQCSWERAARGHHDHRERRRAQVLAGQAAGAHVSAGGRAGRSGGQRFPRAGPGPGVTALPPARARRAWSEGQPGPGELPAALCPTACSGAGEGLGALV